MRPDAVGDPRWLRFNGAKALVRANAPQLHGREIVLWLYNCAVAGVIRVRGDHFLEENLDRYLRGERGWVETDILIDLPKATWSEGDIEVALKPKDAEPRRGRGRQERWDWERGVAELEAKFSLDLPKTVLAKELQHIIADQERSEPGFSNCQKRVRMLIAGKRACGKNRD